MPKNMKEKKLFIVMQNKRLLHKNVGKQKQTSISTEKSISGGIEQ